jgi:hypothetical protein
LDVTHNIRRNSTAVLVGLRGDILAVLESSWPEEADSTELWRPVRPPVWTRVARWQARRIALEPGDSEAPRTLIFLER